MDGRGLRWGRVSTRAWLIVLGAPLVIACVLALCGAQPAAPEASRQRIVVFDPAVSRAEGLAIAAEHGRVRKALPLVSGVSVSLTPSQERRLLRTAGVAFVEADPVVRADVKHGALAESVPWGVDAVDADKVWPRSTGRGVLIAVLDTGADVSHPDLAANLGSGYNVLSPGSQPVDGNGHGTHVCGTVAAPANSLGVVGVAPEAVVLPVKVLDDSGSGRVSDVILGLEWATRHGVDVVNMSFGTREYSEALEMAIRQASDSGVILIASAGNDGCDPGSSSVEYPARFDECIAVGAMASKKRIAEWSSAGPEVDVVAPGAAITSTFPGGSYMDLSGTSMATPHVTGAVALCLQAAPRLDRETIHMLVGSSSRPLKGVLPEQQGAGAVDARALVGAATARDR